jgi:hypothetical protein
MAKIDDAHYKEANEYWYKRRLDEIIKRMLGEDEEKWYS